MIPHFRFVAGVVAAALATFVISHLGFVAGPVATARAVAITVTRGAQDHRADQHPDKNEGDDPRHSHPDRYADHQSADSHIGPRLSRSSFACSVYETTHIPPQ
jgi:hypothetical protein